MEALSFLHISFIDILDVVLVGVLIFLSIRWLRGSSAMSIFLTIITVYVCYVIADALSMKLLSAILSQVISVGLIALIVIFQPEVRRFLMGLGNRYQQSRGFAKIMRWFTPKLHGSSNSTLTPEAIDEMCNAVYEMSEDKVGALIVLRHTRNLDDVIETGDRLDSSINKMMLLQIFFKNSPLHDGALIIDESRIVAARCTLPLSVNADIPAHYGTRHKAALGISEQTDADVIVVSEETGRITFVRNGKFYTVNTGQLKNILWNNKSTEPIEL